MRGVSRLEETALRALKPILRFFSNRLQYQTYKIIYRRYAGLFFTLAVDVDDNELSNLELIHLFVESMDSFFGNVCELDIVFNFQKVWHSVCSLTLHASPNNPQTQRRAHAHAHAHAHVRASLVCAGLHAS